jgi:hypothetical protein
MVLFSTQRGTEDSLLAKPSRRERFTEEVVIAMWGLVLQDVVATIFLDPG